MNNAYKIFDAEYKFMKIVWHHEPVNSTALVKLCLDELGWKKSTTYTVIKKLRDRGILENKDAIVRSLVSSDQVRKFESEQLIDKNFEGSLPSFLSAFLDGKTISEKEADELKKIIESYRG